DMDIARATVTRGFHAVSYRLYFLQRASFYEVAIISPPTVDSIAG
ncbi:unnamed protein product, partial [marine sediment metagenome]